MLQVKDLENGEKYLLYVVDAHHHIGREESVVNTPDGTYRFYERVGQYILKYFKDKSQSELRKDYRLLPERIIPDTFSTNLFSLHKTWSLNNIGWLVDKTIVFPLNDIYARNTKPQFKKSNNIIASITTNAPNSVRLMGFARLNPKDGHLSIQELHRSFFTLGLRGLKLHPISQMFVDEINTEPTLSLAKEAVRLGLPIIFDARFYSTAERIKDLAEKIITELKLDLNKYPLQIKFIIAHCARSFSDRKFFENILRAPYLFGETSTLSGDDIPIFYENAYKYLNTDNSLMSWSDKIILGSDYPLMKEIQLIEHILYLFSSSFFDATHATICDVQKILATNILKLLKPLSIMSGASNSNGKSLTAELPMHNRESLLHRILSLIKNEVVTIASYDPLISGDGCKVDINRFLLSIHDKSALNYLLFFEQNEKSSVIEIPRSMIKNMNFYADFQLNSNLYDFLKNIDKFD
ncbi:MAG: amidohydrolase family protein [Candidatus Asgardarchaeia archaeon]